MRTSANVGERESGAQGRISNHRHADFQSETEPLFFFIYQCLRKRHFGKLPQEWGRKPQFWKADPYTDHIGISPSFRLATGAPPASLSARLPPARPHALVGFHAPIEQFQIVGSRHLLEGHQSASLLRGIDHLVQISHVHQLPAVDLEEGDRDVPLEHLDGDAKVGRFGGLAQQARIRPAASAARTVSWACDMMLPLPWRSGSWKASVRRAAPAFRLSP